MHQILNDYNAKQFPGKTTAYVVPADFDLTPDQKLTWDNYVVDSDVRRLMNIMYDQRPESDFADSDCPTKNDHFSEPYGMEAKKYFGFKDTIVLSDDFTSDIEDVDDDHSDVADGTTVPMANVAANDASSRLVSPSKP